MRLVVKEGGACDGNTCVVPLGASFTLAVEIVGFPDGGYALLQTYVDMGSHLVYKPTDTVGDEFVWPDCLTSYALRENLHETAWLHACLTSFLPPLPSSTYTGNFIELKVSCSDGDSITEVQLLATGTPPANTNGSVFSNPDGSKTVPKTSNLTINCGSGAPPPVTATPTNSPTPDLGNAEMRLVVKKGGACDGDICAVPFGASFTLAVEVVGFPEDGYVLTQTYIEIGPDLVYKPADAPGDEFVWPDCVSSVALRSNLKETSWLHGCLTGLVPPLPASTYTGNLLELKLNCSEDDTSTEVRLIPSSPQLINGGTIFASPDGVITVAKTSNVTVLCGSSDGPINTPQAPTATPVSSGHANCDGAVDAIDASLVLQLDAGLVSTLPCGDQADVNGDGLLNSLDAVLILQFTAALIQQLPAGTTR